MKSDLLRFPYEAVKEAVAGHVIYRPGYRFGPRTQQAVQLILLQAGELRVHINGIQLDVKAGQALLLKPGHEEIVTCNGDQEERHRWIALHTHPLADRERLSLDQLPSIRPMTEELSQLVDVMLTLQDQVPADGPIMRSLALAALHLYSEDASESAELPKPPASVVRALSWIREHYAEEIKLGDLACQAGVSPEHLVRLFRKHEHGTPIHYVWRYRAERAVELLVHTGLSISDIAQQCGFKTPHHFSRTLRQVTGRTPTQIRLDSWNNKQKA